MMPEFLPFPNTEEKLSSLMDPREEGDRFQGLNNDSPRECSNNEADSDS